MKIKLDSFFAVILGLCTLLPIAPWAIFVYFLFTDRQGKEIEKEKQKNKRESRINTQGLIVFIIILIVLGLLIASAST